MRTNLRRLMSLIIGVAMIATLCLPASAAGGSTYYVDVNGSDSAAGSSAAPWKTIQHGLDNIEPGDTLLIRAGTYNEKLELSDFGDENSSLTTIKSAGGRVIVDGTGVDDKLIMFALSDSHHVRIEGMEFCNNFNRAPEWDANVGIQVEASDEGGSVGIQIVNNKIYNMDSETWLEEGDSGNGNGIAVFGYGKSEEAAVKDILVEGNEVYYIRSGWSETVTFNGNVNGFAAIGNYIHDNNNIGLDAIGGEDWLGFEKLWMLENLDILTLDGDTPDAPITAADLDEWESNWDDEWEDLLGQVENSSDIMQLNRARNGLFKGNVVINSTGHGNSAYSGAGGCDGIYVDGGYNITIEDNFVLGAPYGIEIASEIGESFRPEGIIIRNNIVTHSESANLLLGGTRGVKEVNAYNNTFYNPTGNVVAVGAGRGTYDTMVVEKNIIIGNANSYFTINGNVSSKLTYGEGNLFYGGNNIPAGAGTGAGTLPVASLTSGDFTPATGVTQGARLTAETTPFLAQAINNYKARLTAAAVSDAVYAVMNNDANKGTSSSPLTLDKIGDNLCDYFENLDGVAGTGTEVYLKPASGEEFSLKDLYYGYLTVGHGEDGKVNYDAITQNRNLTNIRVYFKTPYESNGQTSYIVRSITAAVKVNNARFVSPDGNDSDAGTFDAPYKTITKGITALQSGERLYIRGGTYNETLTVPAAMSGTAGNQTVISAWQDEEVIVTGTSGARLDISDTHHITIQGITFEGGSHGIRYQATDTRGTADLQDIFILNNTVRDINGTHGINIYNQINDVNVSSALTNVIVRGNHVYGTRTGSSEALVLNGNIDGFEVSGNVVHNNNNIGIDLIGYEGNRSSEAEYFQLNRTRNGVVFDNIVYGSNDLDNSAYWEDWPSEDDDDEMLEEIYPWGGLYGRCCVGIYIDGGSYIEIYNNFLFDNDIGIEIATESEVTETGNQYAVSDLNVHDNIIASSRGWATITFGGYDGNLGFTKNSNISNNILYGGNLAIAVQKSKDVVIDGNIIVGGGWAVNFMPAEDWLTWGDDFTKDDCEKLPSNNNFGYNVWFNLDNVEDWGSELDLLPATQKSKQILAPKNPLKNPAKGDFTIDSAYSIYGTQWRPEAEWLALYAEYNTARQESLAAKEYLESTPFSFAAAADDGNLVTFLNGVLAGAGFENTTAKFVQQTGYSDFEDEEGVVKLGYGDDSGTINAVKLATAVSDLGSGGSAEYAYMVSIRTEYDGGHSYIKEITDSQDGGVRMMLGAAATVSFESNGGSAVDTQKLVVGMTVTRPANPTRSGYSFGGWYTDAAFSTLWNFDDALTEDVTLYAKWSVQTTGPLPPISDKTDEGTGDDKGDDVIDEPLDPVVSSGETQVEFAVAEDGAITVTLDAETLAEMIGEENALVLNIENVDSVSLEFDVAALGDATVTATTPFGSVTLPRGVFASLTEEYGNTITLVISKSSFRIALMAGDTEISYNDPSNPLTITLPVDVADGANSGSYVLISKDTGTLFPFAVVRNGSLTYDIAATGIYDVRDNMVDFADSDHWAKQFIDFSAARGLFKGDGEGFFEPDENVDRAMLVTVLMRLDGAEATGSANPFSDVPEGEWYTDAVIWAAENGIVEGNGDGTYSPHGIITREEMAVMLYRYMRYIGVEFDEASASEFADGGSIATWAAEAVNAMHSAGILNGKLNNRFDPQGFATRGEGATVFTSLIEYISK